ncbi:uncharacterized protein V1510DRAFT_422779 [Dipodascopsis tothii]|uniref:uncharacterized protein n=1 Tax=Dipodascopsis tothii TaxID=44089 RepID=UPI0034CF2FF2
MSTLSCRPMAADLDPLAAASPLAGLESRYTSLSGTETDSGSGDNSSGPLRRLLLPPESTFGPVEYQPHLVPTSTARLEQLTTQMLFRLAQGHGRCVYVVGANHTGELIGLNKSGLQASLHTLDTMCTQAGALWKVSRAVAVNRRRVTEIDIYQNSTCKDVVKVFFTGASGAGKSSVLGRLAHSTRDDGCGRARGKVLRHKHEQVSGKTTSVACEVFGFSAAGIVAERATRCVPALAGCGRVVMAFDTPGSRPAAVARYASVYSPEATCVLISADTADWRRFLRSALRTGGRTAVAITKVDKLASAAEIRKLVNDVLVFIALSGGTNGDRGSYKSRLVATASAAAQAAAAGPASVPVFLISSVTDAGVDCLTTYLRAIPTRIFSAPSEPGPKDAVRNFKSFFPTLRYETQPGGFYVTSIFDSGRILSGVVRWGKVVIGNIYTVVLPAPDTARDDDSVFETKVRIISVHRLREPCIELRQGDVGSVAVEFLDPLVTSTFKRGVSLVSGPNDLDRMYARAVVLEGLADVRGFSVDQHVVVVSGFRRTGTVKEVNAEPNGSGSLMVELDGSARDAVIGSVAAYVAPLASEDDIWVCKMGYGY